MTGNIFLALLTFGLWSDPKPSCSQLAAKVREFVHDVMVSPEAIDQRFTTRAVAVLKALIRNVFAKLQARDQGCDDDLFHRLTHVSIADSTGFELPEPLKESCPGCGGSASQAGAKLPWVWDSQQSAFGLFERVPLKIPDHN